jgi:hypothetical protein
MTGIAMDTSPSAEPLIEPRVVMLTSVKEQAAAIDELIPLARRQIRVFDRDLAQTGWDSVVRAERLGAFLRQVRGRRLDIIVHDTRYLERACPRILALLRAFSDSMSVLKTGDEAKVATDPLVIVDTDHYLHRFHYDQPRAALGIAQPEQAQPLASRFGEIWATGEVGASGTVLGL